MKALGVLMIAMAMLLVPLQAANALGPGGIRVKSRRAVRLIVRVKGNPEPIPLPLGRPKAYEPR